MTALIILIIAFGPFAALCATAIYARGCMVQLQELRKELSHRAENDIKMFNANREAAGLPPL